MSLNVLKSCVKNVFAWLLAFGVLVPTFAWGANNAIASAQSIPTTMVAGEPYTITLAFRNTGTASWTSAGKYCAKLLAPAGWEFNSRCVSTTVAVGQFLYVNHTARAPSTPGVYNYQWQMEQQGVGLFGTASTNVAITVAPRVQSMQFVTHNVPAMLSPGTREIFFTYKNTSNFTWKAGQYALVAQNPENNSTWGISRLMLVTPTVAPGAIGSFRDTITAPSTFGYYGMQWRPMEVGKGYVGDPTPPLNIPITGPAPTVNVEKPTVGQTFIGNGGFIDVPVKVTATPSGIATVSKIEILVYNTATSTFTVIDSVEGPVFEKTLRRAAVDQTLYVKATDSFNKFTQTTFKIDALVDYSLLVSHTIPPKMVPGVEYDVTVTMKNTGGTTWTPEGVELITTNPVGNTTFGITSMPLATSIPPGGTAVFSGRMKAPATEGTVQTQWRLHEKTRAAFGAAALVSVALARELPVVTMTSPVQGAAFEPPTGTTAQVEVQGSATPGINATISKLEIFEGAIVHATVNGSSINQLITLSAGTHALRLRATDNWGKIGFSPIASISVKANNADYISQSAITALAAGTTYNYAVTMRNTGSKPWSVEEGHGFAVPDPQIAENWGMPHATPKAVVAVGGLTTFLIPIIAPSVPGMYDLQFQMLQDGREWFGEQSLKRQIQVKPELPTVAELTAPLAGARFIASGGKASVDLAGSAAAGPYATITKLEVLNASSVAIAVAEGDKIATTLQLIPGTHTLRLRATDNFGQVVTSTTATTITVLSNNATFVSATVPATMVGGQKHAVSVGLRNSGTSTWTAEEGYRLVGVTPAQSGVVVPLPGPIAPGATAQFDFEVDAPPDPGSYAYQWQMSRDLNPVEFFGSKTTSRTATVTAGAPPSVNISSPKTGDTFTAINGKASVSVTSSGKVEGTATTAMHEILDGTAVIASSNQTVYSPTLSLAPGTHSIQSRITDSRGGIALSNVVTITVLHNQATFVEQSISNTMFAGERYPVWVKLRNTGSLAWQPNFVLRALNPVDNSTWSADGRRPLNAVVAPGSEFTFAFHVVAPSTTGIHNFQWRLEDDKGQIIGADTPNVGVTVGPVVVPTVALTAAPGNVRVAPGQTATITLTGSASVQGGQINKLEVFKDKGAGYEATPLKVVNGPAVNLQINEAIALPGGSYRLKLRATDTGNRTAESTPVLVNVTDSALLGAISGVRSNAAQKLELVGWVCRAGSDEIMSYDIYANAPASHGGTKVGSGIANVGTEPSDTSIRTACGTPASSHHFVANLAEVAVQYPGARLYVEARASNGTQVVLPCEDNNCRVPEGIRIGLTSPNATNTDHFRDPAPAFLRAVVSGYTGTLDEVAFHVNGEWLPGVSEGAGAYSVSKSGLSPNSLPYVTYAKVRQGGTTVITEERQFYVDAGIVPGVVSPATGTVVGTAAPTVLSTIINDTVYPGQTVKFYISKTGMPAPLAAEATAPQAGSGTIVGTAMQNGTKWSYSWKPAEEGFYEIVAKLLDGNGVVLMETPAVTVAVSMGVDPVSVIPDAASLPAPDELSLPDTGSLPGALSVSNSGAATYSIPLVVPPGTAGMAPNFSLNYSSDGTNGVVGLGWTLGGLSTVHRCGKTIAQDKVNDRVSFDTSDRLCLDGQRLVLQSGATDDAAYWSDGAVYRTEIETFARVTAQGAYPLRTFLVESKDGRKRSYGDETSLVKPFVGDVGGYRPEAKSGPRAWALAKEIDRSGNYVKYEYSQNKDTGEHRIESVLYGAVGKAAHAGVAFVWQDRKDAWKRYVDETRNDLRSRIAFIRTYVDMNTDDAVELKFDAKNAVREYRLAYDYSETSGRSLLSSIEVCAENQSGLLISTECLPPTVFNWGKRDATKTPGFVSRGTWANAPILTTVKTYSGGPAGANNAEYFAFSDFNGDGFGDVLEKRVAPMIDDKSDKDRNPLEPGFMQDHYRYFHNNRSGFTVHNYRIEPKRPFMALDVGDFNGDGALDLVITNEQYALQVCLSPLAQGRAPTSETIVFTCPSSFNTSGLGGADQQPFVVDVIGEGRSAIYSRVKQDGAATVCKQGTCVEDLSPSTVILGATTGTDGTPEHSLNNFHSLSQMVDFAGVGKPYSVHWSRPHFTEKIFIDNAWVDHRKWDNLTPTVSVNSLTYPGTPAIESIHPHRYPTAAVPTYRTWAPYEFDAPSQLGGLSGDFSGSGYASIAYGYKVPVYTTSGITGLSKAEFTICQSTGRMLDCEVRQKYSGSEYRSINAVGNFVGDGMPSILVQTMTYTGPLGPRPSGNLEMCRLLGDANALDHTDTNTVCETWGGITMPNTNPSATGRQVYFMDLLGTGRTQLVLYHGGYVQDGAWKEDGSWEVFEPKDVAQPNEALDRIVSVTNGVGLTSRVEYVDGLVSGIVGMSGQSQFLYPQQVVNNTGKVVQRLIVGNGISAPRETTYRYEDGANDLAGRGSLGFAKVIEQDEGTKIITTLHYSQAWPHIGSLLASTAELAGVIFANTTNKYSHVSVGATVFPYLEKSTTVRSELDGTDPVTTVTTFGYDDGFGNVTRQTATVTTGVGGDPFITETVTTYLNNSGLWLIGLPNLTTITRTSPGTPSITRTLSASYDPDTGLKMGEIVEPDNEKLRLETVFGRNGFGQVETVTQHWKDPIDATMRSRVASTLGYDPHGRFIVSNKNAVHAAAELYTHDAATGARTSHTDLNNLLTRWSVNGFGRVVVEARPDGNSTNHYVKACGGSCPTSATTVQIVEQFHGTQRIAVPQLSYIDAAGHLLRVKTWGFNGKPVVVDQRYDARGLLEEVDHPRYDGIDGEAAVTAKRMRYDALNRVIRVETPDEAGVWTATTTTYKGLTTVITNPLDQSRTDIRDAIGQLRKVIDAKGGETLFDYDAFGNLEKTTDPNKNVIEVKYDGLGRKTRLIDPDLGQIDYTNDPLGRNRRTTSPKQRAESQSGTLIEYDMLDRMTRRLEPDLDSRWEYDTALNGRGKLAGAYTMAGDNQDYARLHTYDAMGRPVSTTQKLDNESYVSESNYDLWGRPVAISHKYGTNGVKTFRLRYNPHGYHAKIERGGLVLWEVTQQDAANRVLSATLGNGLVQTREYNGYTARQAHGQVKAGQAPRLTEGYDYDAIGNVLQRTHGWDNSSFSESFTYDKLNRLETSTLAGQEMRYEYDAAGNILKKAGVGTGFYRYPEQGANAMRPHAVASIDGLGAFDYDANGNQTKTPWGSSNWTSFDMPQKLSKGDNWSTFLYGPEHQRLRQTRNDGTVIIYAGAQEVEKKGTLVRVKTFWPNGVGVEIDETNAAQRKLWMHVDRLGSVMGLSREDGSFESRTIYDPWGKRRQYNGSSTDDNVAGDEVRRGFTGHEMLDELDLVHMNGRVYDPFVGRFLSGDPIIQDPLNGQNYSRYTYVFNNPTNLTDPTGFISCDKNGGSGDCGGKGISVAAQTNTIEKDPFANHKEVGESSATGKPKDSGSNNSPNAKLGGADGVKKKEDSANKLVEYERKSLTQDVSGTANNGDPVIRIVDNWERKPVSKDRLVASFFLFDPIEGGIRTLGFNQQTGMYGSMILGAVNPRQWFAKGAKKVAAKSLSKSDAVIAETLAGKGNITSTHTLTADELLKAGEDFLGQGYNEIGKAGSGVFRSADGTRQFRIDGNSLSGNHAPGVPHGHLETYAPGASKPSANNHIPFND